MELVPVNSSNIRAVGYEEETATLVVEFEDGAIYHYLNVPSPIFEGLLSAPSKGTYFDRHVKKSGFAYRRVG